MPASPPTALTPQGLLVDDVERMRARLVPLFDSLRGRTLLITGATGFFGKWLLAALGELNARDQLGIDVVAVSRTPDRFLSQFPAFGRLSGVRYLAGDVSTFAVPLPRVDLVIHAANDSATPPSQQRPADMLDVNVMGTRALLSALQRTQVKRVLVTSSGAVYGKQPSDLVHVPESYLGAPDPMELGSAYGEGKRVAELMGVIAAREQGFEFVSARCFAFMGAYLALDGHFAAGNFIRDALKGGPIVVGGDGTPHRSYLYAGDLAVWLLTLLVRGTSARAYNVGSDDSVSISTLAHRIAAQVPGCQVEVKQAADPKKPVLRYVPNVERARTELGLDVFTPLDEAISRMLATVRAQRQGER